MIVNIISGFCFAKNAKSSINPRIYPLKGKSKRDIVSILNFLFLLGVFTSWTLIGSLTIFLYALGRFKE